MTLLLLHCPPLPLQFKHGWSLSHLMRWIRHQSQARATWPRFFCRDRGGGRELDWGCGESGDAEALEGGMLTKVENMVLRAKIRR